MSAAPQVEVRPPHKPEQEDPTQPATPTTSNDRSVAVVNSILFGLAFALFVVYPAIKRLLGL